MRVVGKRVLTISDEGSGKGLDADTLDGQQHTHFLDYNNFTNTPTIPTNNNQLTNGAGFITSADGGNASQLNSQAASYYLDYNNFSNTPTIPSGNQIIDWTASGAGTIHSSNYTNTTYSVGDGGLTEKNFTSTLKTKLDGIAAGAEVNVQSDWNASSGDAQILNKPAVLTTSTTFGGDVSGTYNAITVSNDSHTHNFVVAVDDRDMKPNTSGVGSGVKGMRAFFSTYGGMTGSANTDYQDVLVLDTYSDTSGGNANAITLDKSDGTMRIWNAGITATSWGSPKTVYTTANLPTIPTNNNQLTNGAGYVTTSGWTSGNDGSGSGLDADTCDGQHLGTGANVTFNYIHLNGVLSGLTGGGSWIGRNYAYDTCELLGYGAEFMIGAQHGGAIHINYRYCNGSSSYTPDNWYWRNGTSSSWSSHNFGSVTSNGNVYATGNVTAYSDIRLKENIRPIQNALDVVSKLEGVHYTRKETGEEEIGFIAQDVKEVFPELVEIIDSRVDDPHEGWINGLVDLHVMKYQNAVALLVEAIKEQQAQIDDIKQTIN